MILQIIRELFYFWCFLLYLAGIKHNYFCVNVVLEVMGYKIYNCKYKNEDNELVEKKILSKKYLKKNVGAKIRVRYLNNEYVLDCTEVLKEELN